ncbi:hypothetical protein [Denitrobaculum tricleocarpae]|uniref:Uncharacterized protein n=1 Tax=Denitrobaculum tricleocarpae TaxID=2591009 RepID=A0A545TF01_9PROT|nr:hypothetical protein [Denitrobaculum tricleocarpae]TQV75765.1 hypothetical protein FKG95_22910 [Denitrobaculum tricleocarpae]
MEFAERPGGGYNEPTVEFKNNPTIENYLHLRRSDPDAEIEISVFGGIDALFAMEDELERFGFDPQTVASIFDADEDAVSSLSLQLMEKIVQAKELTRDGETHLVRRGIAVPDKLIDWLICAMLDSLSWNNELIIHRDLIVPIRERLGGPNPQYQQTIDAHEKRQAAIWLAAQMKAQGTEPTIRGIAQHFAVAPSTVARWFPGTSFQEEAEKLSKFFDKDGNIEWPSKPE